MFLMLGDGLAVLTGMLFAKEGVKIRIPVARTAANAMNSKKVVRFKASS